MIYTKHFCQMLCERSINEEWVERTIKTPDKTESKKDGTQHFLKQIPEYGNRWLRIVVDTTVSPEKGITIFFDRRMRRK